jgi:hypothetical protein
MFSDETDEAIDLACFLLFKNEETKLFFTTSDDLKNNRNGYGIFLPHE